MRIRNPAMKKKNFKSGSEFWGRNWVKSSLICPFNRGVIILSLEYHSVWPFVRIGSPRPHSQVSVSPSFGTKQEGNIPFLGWGGGGGVGPSRTTEEKAWHSVSWRSLIVLRLRMRDSPFVWAKAYKWEVPDLLYFIYISATCGVRKKTRFDFHPRSLLGIPTEPVISIVSL